MPYKDKNKQLQNNKLWKRKQRQTIYHKEIPEVQDQEAYIYHKEIPEVQDQEAYIYHKEIPEVQDQEAYIFHSIRRFELFYDTIQMREELQKQTNFNNWMRLQLDIIYEINEYHK
jgi:hypothetical protein